jgi:acyl carrier protein
VPVIAVEHRCGQRTKECSVASVEEVKEKVVSIVSEQLNIPKDDIKLESAFIADLKADSLDLVELVMEFEDEFGVQIPESDQDKIQTVGNAVDYIMEKQ